ncbi:MAG TPA: Crp/Fnr family transcriptional regulator [Clostridia bacterium]|nr:Crp/Fnr family transcriptional regulator [Clostridia bacterium]
MEKFPEILKTVPLFSGMDEEDIRSVLFCLGAVRAHKEKKQLLFQSGDTLTSLGIVLAGEVQIYQEDYYGNKSIFANIGPGGLFAESFACAATKSVPVSAVASEESDVLYLDCRRLASPCEKSCDFHARLIRNLLDVLAKKNVFLTQRFEFTAKRTTREKALAYLSEQARLAGGSRFTIPFDRQELADYLCVERSGLSAELAKLRDEGIIRFRKNEFELLKA